MNNDKFVMKFAILVAIISLSLSMFSYISFTIFFLVLGLMAAMIINYITGLMVSILMVWFVEYLLMLSVLAFSYWRYQRKKISVK